jgi:hypothetical protein
MGCENVKWIVTVHVQCEVEFALFVMKLQLCEQEDEL